MTVASQVAAINAVNEQYVVKVYYCTREDEAHVMLVIAAHMIF